MWARPSESRIRILTIFGTRPEIIRLSRIIPILDSHAEHVLVHTGQNYEPKLSDIFLAELHLRAPDLHLGVRTEGFAQQAALIIDRADQALERFRPDRVLILGDTNSGLSAIAAARRRIPVYHLEAGNRCYDDRVPEEVNRRVIDHCSTFLLPYTERSMGNLLREGFERERIFVVGNPINEVLNFYGKEIESSAIDAELGVAPGAYLLATMHRAENVDEPSRLERLCTALGDVAADTGLPVVWPVHPRTRERLGLRPNMLKPAVKAVEPLGFFDFVHLERGASCVITDSGTVQEECAIFHVPNVTIRDVTERPETIEAGSNIIAGSDPAAVVHAVRLARALPSTWTAPSEYLVANASTAIAKIVLGHGSSRQHGG
jgi:UDP-N-acetylglucosamine 2-epimerase (non-hydrolysing)